MTPEAIIAALGLEPHPEGGHFVETWRHVPESGGRGAMTSIWYLLQAGEVSAWHRVTDATEIWYFQAGDPLALTLSPDGHGTEVHRLGPDLAADERPQLVVSANCWQTAETLGRWTLVACAVAPAFEFESFELASPDWRPAPREI